MTVSSVERTGSTRLIVFFIIVLNLRQLHLFLFFSFLHCFFFLKFRSLFCWVDREFRFCFFFFSLSINARSNEHASFPPRGWNSYDSFCWTISEAEFLQSAEIVSKRLLPHGYEVILP